MSLSPGLSTFPDGDETLRGYNGVVPFGDLNGDGYNDLLLRDTTGRLTVRYGKEWPVAPDFDTAETKVVGTGWTGLTLVTSGDLTGDGRPDLLAKDSAGVLRRYNGTAAGGFAKAVAVAGTWNQPMLLGPGDVTGDGKADLYGTSTTGDLYLYRGTGTGDFAAGTKVGSGWGPYQAIGVGDATQDTRNDLVARDTGGTLWLYPGNGSGGFGPRQQITQSGDTHWAVIY
jgi:hypothetical protein